MRQKKYILLGVLLMLLSFLSACREEIEITEVLAFDFSCSNSMDLLSAERYSLDYTGEYYIAFVKPALVPESEAIYCTVNESFVRELEELLRKYEIGKWNGFHKSSKFAMDGDSFQLNIRMQDGDSLEADGYMKRPKNYSSFVTELAALFGKLEGSNVEIREIESFDFYYSNGYAAYSDQVYTLEYVDGGYIAKIKPAFVPEEEELSFPVEESFARELEDLLREYEIGRWHGFQWSDSGVLDGDFFGLSVRMQGDTHIRANGYMAWPRNYGDFSAAVEAQFEKLRE
ncbi:MAG: hypothetical protein Q4B50_02370 [Bacillota bacterium]|nr:hypothetical protein [Bacillota bacterium]